METSSTMLVDSTLLWVSANVAPHSCVLGSYLEEPKPALSSVFSSPAKRTGLVSSRGRGNLVWFIVQLHLGKGECPAFLCILGLNPAGSSSCLLAVVCRGPPRVTAQYGSGHERGASAVGPRLASVNRPRYDNAPCSSNASDGHGARVACSVDAGLRRCRVRRRRKVVR